MLANNNLPNVSFYDKNSFILSEIGDNLSNMLNPNDLSDVSSPLNHNHVLLQPQKIISTSSGNSSIVMADKDLKVRKVKSSNGGGYIEKKRTMAISLNKLAEQIEEKGNKRYGVEEH